MRDVLLKRVRELSERFANDLTAVLMARVERDLAHVGNILEYSLSAIASDLFDEVTVTETPPTPKKSHHKPRETRVRDYTPDTYPPSRRVREERGTTQANGAKPITCSKCGYVGGNARGCGTAHPPQSKDSAKEVNHGAAGPVRSAATPTRRPVADADAKPMTAIAPPRTLKPTPEALAAAKQRSKERQALIAARAGSATANTRRAPEPELHEYDPDNLPIPRATFDSAGFPRGGTD